MRGTIESEILKFMKEDDRMIKDEKKSKLKILIFNAVSAMLIVILWFIFYYFFENYGWLFFSKEESELTHLTRPWEDLNMLAFFIAYFLIELVNYCFTDMPLRYYTFLQAILDFALFFACMVFMDEISWYAPITGVAVDEYTSFRAMVLYCHQYIGAASGSNIVMLLIHGISIFLKRRKS